MSDRLAVLRRSRSLCLHVFAAGLLAVSVVAGTAAAAQESGDIDRLAAALRLTETMDVMAQEGLDYGDDLAEGLLGGAPPDWAERVAAIYDPARMEAEMRAALSEALAGADIAPIAAFFEAEPGRSFIALELSARTAMLDPEVDAAAREAAAIALADSVPRIAILERFITANDLIESNVMGGLNGNYAFLTGLQAGGALPGGMTEEQILSDVWAQEPEIRASTTEWVYAYLFMAYSPATDADLEAYIAFSESPAGRTINAALFAAYDAMFNRLSHALGLAAAEVMATQEL